MYVSMSRRATEEKMNQESQKDMYDREQCNRTGRALRFNCSHLLELVYSLHSREQVEILKCRKPLMAEIGWPFYPSSSLEGWGRGWLEDIYIIKKVSCHKERQCSHCEERSSLINCPLLWRVFPDPLNLGCTVLLSRLMPPCTTVLLSCCAVCSYLSKFCTGPGVPQGQDCVSSVFYLVPCTDKVNVQVPVCWVVRTIKSACNWKREKSNRGYVILWFIIRNPYSFFIHCSGHRASETLAMS